MPGGRQKTISYGSAILEKKKAVDCRQGWRVARAAGRKRLVKCSTTPIYIICKILYTSIVPKKSIKHWCGLPGYKKYYRKFY